MKRLWPIAYGLDAKAFLPALTAALACSLLARFADASSWFQRSCEADGAGFERFVALRLGTFGRDRDLDPRAIYLIREFDRLEACDCSRYRGYVRESAYERMHQRARRGEAPRSFDL